MEEPWSVITPMNASVDHLGFTGSVTLEAEFCPVIKKKMKKTKPPCCTTTPKQSPPDDPQWVKDDKLIRHVKVNNVNSITQQNNEEDTNNNNNINNMKYGNWERVKVTVDSGAVRSVMPKHVASVYDVEETSLSRRNANFLAANDTVIKNHGQRRVNAVDDKWNQTSMHFQVADVSKTLASVRELDASGHITMMGNNSGYIKNIKSGKTILLYAEGGEYKFDLWVPT